MPVRAQMFERANERASEPVIVGDVYDEAPVMMMRLLLRGLLVGSETTSQSLFVIKRRKRFCETWSKSSSATPR